MSGDQSKGQPQPKHTLIINLLSLVNHSHTHTHTLQGLRPANICQLHLYEHAGRENRIHADESEQPWQACTLLSIVVVLVVLAHMTAHHHRTTMDDSGRACLRSAAEDTLPAAMTTCADTQQRETQHTSRKCSSAGCVFLPVVSVFVSVQNQQLFDLLPSAFSVLRLSGLLSSENSSLIH